jgi:uncharacterized HAD superfamily protein
MEVMAEFEMSRGEAMDEISMFIQEYNFKVNNAHKETDPVIKFFLDRAYNADTILSAPVDEEGKQVIRLLKRGGHSIHFITSRSKKFKELTIQWLRNNKILFDSINFVGHNGEKGVVARSLNLDFFLDDLEKSLESLYKYKKRWRKGLCLLDKPWNADYIDGSRFIRMKNWQAVYRHLGIHNR